MLHRRNLKQSLKFQYRLEQEAINLRKQAEGMPPGIQREELLRKSNQLLAEHSNVSSVAKIRLRLVVPSAKGRSGWRPASSDGPATTLGKPLVSPGCARCPMPADRCQRFGSPCCQTKRAPALG